MLGCATRGASMKDSWYSIKAKANAADISIHDEIGHFGVNAKQFIDELKAFHAVDTITLSVHSPGGDVLDGWAIFNALQEHPAEIHAKVEGFAGSMASVILMAADHISMPENAFLMIHNPWAGVIGDAQEMIDMAATLEKIQNGIVSAYVKRTGLDAETVEDLMRHETFMDGAEAVERGFADVVLETVKAAACASAWKERIGEKEFPKGLVFGKAEPAPEPTPEPKPTQQEPIETPIAMSEEPKSAEKPQISIKDALAADKPRRDEIQAIGKKFNLSDDQISKAIEDGVEIETFRNSVLDGFDPESFTATVAGGEINASELKNSAHVGDKSAERYSLFKALKQHVNEGRLDGLEKEVQDELAANYRNATGKVADGLLIPAEYWNSKSSGIQNAATVGTGTSGGNTVETEMQGLTDYLKDYSILPRLGATIFRDAVGNLDFPRSTAGYSGTWDSETDTIANADASFAANLTLSPKRVGAGTAVSKQLLAQSSVDFESWVRGELQYAIATAVDRAAITGAGGDAPTGVLSASGTDAYTWQAGSALWVNIVEQIEDYRDNNAPLERGTFLTDTATWSNWYQTQLAASTGKFVIEENPNNMGYTVAGRPFYEHTDVTATKVILGDFSRLFVAMWGGIMLTYDPYSQKKSGQVELYAETFADCGLLQPNAFVIGDDGTAHAGALS